jgi:hypothetical protein
MIIGRSSEDAALGKALVGVNGEGGDPEIKREGLRTMNGE